MDSDMMNMMMQHIDKLPDFCTNPNSDSHNIINPNIFYTQNQISPDPIPQEPGFRYSGSSYPCDLERRNNINNNGTNSTSMAAMREMIFRIAVMQPIHIDPEAIKPPKRRNVKISKDPQSVAARHRRERISERIRILQRLVPGGTKMDTASMLDEAIHYVKFLKKQVQSLEQQAVVGNGGGGGGIMMLPNNGGGGGCGGMRSSHQTVGNHVQMLR